MKFLKVKLVNGEEISIDGNTCRHPQTFVRLSKSLVIGCFASDVKNTDEGALYVYKKNEDGDYSNVGDVSLYCNESGTTSWKVYPSTLSLWAKREAGKNTFEEVRQLIDAGISAEDFIKSGPIQINSLVGD